MTYSNSACETSDSKDSQNSATKFPGFATSDEFAAVPTGCDDALSVGTPDECRFMKSQQNRKLQCSHYLTAKTRRNQQEVSSLQVNYEHFIQLKKKTHSSSNSYSGQPCRHMRTTDQRCLIFVFQLKLPHCAREKGHSLLVLLATAAANLQSAPSPPAGTLPRHSHDVATPRVELCVVWPRCLSTARPREPMPSFTWASALPCSLEKRLVLSLCRQAFLYFRSLAFDRLLFDTRNASSLLRRVGLRRESLGKDPRSALDSEIHSAPSDWCCDFAPMHEGTPSVTSPRDTDTINKRSRDTRQTALLRESNT